MTGIAAPTSIRSSTPIEAMNTPRRPGTARARREADDREEPFAWSLV
jgi:hypothetical protein